MKYKTIHIINFHNITWEKIFDLPLDSKKLDYLATAFKMKAKIVVSFCKYCKVNGLNMTKFSLLLSFLFIGLSLTSAQDCPPPENIGISQNNQVVWTEVDEAIAYSFQYREVGLLAWEKVDIEETVYQFSPEKECVLYEIRVLSKCGDDIYSTTPSNIVNATKGCEVCFSDEYCTSENPNNNLEFLQSFSFGSYSNDSGMDENGYANYTGNPIMVNPGESYDFEITPGYSGFEYNEFMAIYIDFNGNMDFEDEEMVYITPQGTNQTVTGTIDIPSDVAAANARMRVILNFGSFFSACDVGSFGEIEDYCLVFTSACDLDFPFELESTTPNGPKFVWEKYDEFAAFNYRYKKTSENENDWTYLSTDGDNVTLTELDQCEEYEIEIRTVCAFDTSTYKYNTVFDSYCPTAVTNPLAIDMIQYYPNPWSEQLNVSIDSKESMEVNIFAFDASGRKFDIQRNVRVSIGDQVIRLHANPQMGNGLYVICIEKNGRIIHQDKVLKL